MNMFLGRQKKKEKRKKLLFSNDDGILVMLLLYKITLIENGWQTIANSGYFVCRGKGLPITFLNAYLYFLMFL